MPDIELRFHKDMLVLSAPSDYALARQGVDMDADAEYVTLMEPETVRDILKLEAVAGAQCLVAATEGICEARLAHKRMEDRAVELAQAAVSHVLACAPQHVVCEVGTCGLPLDASSAASVKQMTAQYAHAAAALVEGARRAAGEAEQPASGACVPIDAILLSGMRSAAEMRCAIEGARGEFAGPLFASVDLSDRGLFAGEPVEQAVAAMAGADVVGIRSAAGPSELSALVGRLAASTDVPILVQIEVRQATSAEKRLASLGREVEGNPYAAPDSLADAALALRAAGAQFLRAVGQATPACTGAIAAAVSGLDCAR